MEQNYLCMDIGGTQIKVGIFRRSCIDKLEKLSEISNYPAYAEESKEKIIENVRQIIKEFMLVFPDSICGICMAFPGPFDYEKGISRITGIHKYDAIYGIDLKRELGKEITIPMFFINDVDAFAFGQLYFGKLKDTKKAMFLCIGTGCGSAFSIEKNLIKEEGNGVPKNGYIYAAPFFDGCIDDYLSKRGLEFLSENEFGERYDGLQLSKMAEDRNRKALLCFKRFGEWILKALKIYLDTFKPDTLVMGGQVIKSAFFFIEPIQEYCREKKIQLVLVKDTSLYSLQGAVLSAC